MSCVVKSNPDFRNLAKELGEGQAEYIIRGYTRSLGRSMDDLVYPTVNQALSFLKKARKDSLDNFRELIAVNPYISIEEIRKVLKPVMSKYSGNFYAKKGDTDKATVDGHILSTLNNITYPNAEAMTTLAEEFPYIFTVYPGNSKYVTRVRLTTPKERMREDVTEESEERYWQVFSMEKGDLEKTKARSIAEAMGDKLSAAFNIGYDIVSEADAINILMDSETPYNGQPAFFFKNHIYFIEGNFNLQNVLHEFSHPLIKGLAQDNNKLFNKLYNDLIITDQGKAIKGRIENLYPKLDVESDRFKEEVLVTALEEATHADVTKQTADEEGFKSFINKLLYALKQILRKVFGKKINIGKLTQNTTLEELANMLVNEDFVISDLQLSESNFAEFKVGLENLIKQIKSPDILQDLVNKAYGEAVHEDSTLRAAPWKLKEELKGDQTALSNIKKMLGKHQTIEAIGEEEMAEAVLAETEEFRDRSIAFISTLTQIKEFSDGIYAKLAAMEKKGQHLSHGGISKVMFYKKFLQRQERFLDSLRDVTEQNSDNILTKRIRDIGGIVNDSLKKAKLLTKDFVIEFFVDGTDIMSNAVEDTFNEKVSTLLKLDNYTQEEIDKFIKAVYDNRKEDWTGLDALGKELLPKKVSRPSNLTEMVNQYYAKRLGREEITAYLNGEMEDLGLISSMLLPYMNIDDPLIGGLARFVKSKLSDMESKSYKMYNDILRKALPELQAVGYNPNSTQQLADLVLFTDKVGVQKEDGTFDPEAFEVLTFMNRFMNYRFDKAQLQHNLDKAKEDGNTDAIREAMVSIWDFDENFMHRPMTNDYYKVKKIWNQDNVITNPINKEKVTISKALSQEAFIERQNALIKMNTWSNVNLIDRDNIHITPEYDAAKTNYRQLYNPYDLGGYLKTGDELKKVLVRQEHKKESSKFYDYSPNTEKIQKDYNYFIQTYLPSKGITKEADPDKYQKEMDAFLKNNFHIAYSQEYYNKRNELFNNLAQINDKYANASPIAAELSMLYLRRSKLVGTLNDENRQPDGTYLTENQTNTLLEIEKKIVKLNSEFDQKSGLSKEDSEKLKQYTSIIASGAMETLTKAQYAEYETLFNKSASLGMSQADEVKFKEIMAELGGLSDKIATEYYVDAFQYAVNATASLDVKAELIDTVLPTGGELTIENADEWINNPENLDKILKSDSVKEWFEKNHYQKNLWDVSMNGGKGGMRLQWVRTAAWTITKPSQEEYYMKTEVKDPITGKSVFIPGVPSSKYTISKIKDEYLTIKPGMDKKDYIGIIKDNKGNFLPRAYKEGDPNSAISKKYINEEYEALEREAGARFRLIKSLTESTLKMQDGKAKSSKLYLDLPRFRQNSNLELLQTGKTKEKGLEIAHNLKEYGQSLFKKKSDDAEQAFNYNRAANLVSTDLNGDPISKVPIRGLYRMEKKDVSRDVLQSLFTYLHSINQQDALMEMQPIADSIKDAFINSPDSAVKDMTKASKQVHKNTGVYQFLGGTENNRGQAMDYFIDKVFYGQANMKFDEENPTATKVANLMMKHASRAFIMLDLTSALKNRYGMMLQSLIEAAGGKYMTYKSLANGRIWSAKTIVELSSKGIYSRGPKSLDIQITEIFDPVTGKTKKDFGKASSRTFMKDFLDGTWMFDSRRLLDFEAGLQLFGGMMHNKFVPQIQEDGSSKPVKYIEAWELDADQQAVIKKGIDPAWGNTYTDHDYIIGDTWESLSKKYYVPVEELQKRNKSLKIEDLVAGDKVIISRNEYFTDFKLKIQGIGKKLNGQMDDLDSPQANKYLQYRMFSFYKRYAMPMFLNRFQYDTAKDNKYGDVYDWEMGDLTKGYYINGLRAMKKVLFESEKYLPIMTPTERVALKKMLSEGVYLAVLGLAAGLLFGYDDGDEDRFTKMRDREEEYGVAGWMANHILYQLIMVRTENEAFIPIPGVGMGDWLEFTNSTTIATGPTIGVWAKIIGDLGMIAFGDEKARYSQDAGPYSWQEEGDYKLWNHLWSLIGVKGKNYDPVTAIKKAEIFENSKLS